MRPSRLLAALAGLIAAAPASGATPNPDRPSFSRTAFLVSSQSLELEGGLNFAPGAPTASLLPKLGLGRIEPRMGIDVDGGGIGLTPGMKFGIVQESGIAVAAHAHVGVPSYGGLSGEAGGLVTSVLAGGQVLQANLGVRTALTGSGIQVIDMPLAALVGAPLSQRWSSFGEIVLLLNQDSAPVQLNGGLGYAITRSVIADSALSWTPGSDTIGVTVGLTANFGRVE